MDLRRVTPPAAAGGTDAETFDDGEAVECEICSDGEEVEPPNEDTGEGIRQTGRPRRETRPPIWMGDYVQNDDDDAP